MGACGTQPARPRRGPTLGSRSRSALPHVGHCITSPPCHPLLPAPFRLCPHCRCILPISHPPYFFHPHFAAVDEYVCTFDPLVLEEAREGLKSDWAESCAGGRAWAVEVVRCVLGQTAVSAACLLLCASKSHRLWQPAPSRPLKAALFTCACSPPCSALPLAAALRRWRMGGATCGCGRCRGTTK